MEMMMISSGITHYPVGLTAPPPKSIVPRAARLAGSQSRSVASSDLVRLRFFGVVMVVAGENGGWSRVARPDPHNFYTLNPKMSNPPSKT
jgi:hypothetical protein